MAGAMLLPLPSSTVIVAVEVLLSTGSPTTTSKVKVSAPVKPVLGV